MKMRSENEKPKELWCAIYTRKSTDENLNTDFTSLDSQREYCQAFVKSREGEGWRVYPETYNDPGYSGGNMDRPGLKKLIADAQQGKFQAVVCYKYDRLSRNTKDFLHVLDIFDKRGVAFVSVTQPIDTTSSVGRLMRSILMDFAQFEREMIGERTRDKLLGMAKKGKRTGGHPILGYDLNKEKKTLEVNEEESKQVLELFNTYMKTKSVRVTAKTLNERGYGMKKWVTHSGKPRGGSKFNKTNLYNLLTNTLYVGKIRHRRKEYPGEHKAILPQETFERVQELLSNNGNGKAHKNTANIQNHIFLLRAILRCACCNAVMTPTSGYNRKGKKFFYYRCTSVNNMDKTACRVRSVSAEAIETHTIRRLKVLGEKEDLVNEVIKKAQALTSQDLPVKLDEKRIQAAELSRTQSVISNIVEYLGLEKPDSAKHARISAELDRYIAKEEEIKARLAKLDGEIEELEKQQIDADIVRKNLVGFTRVFNELGDCEKKELLHLLLKVVTYDPENRKITLHLNPLPDLWGEETTLEQVLDDRQTSLPD